MARVTHGGAYEARGRYFMRVTIAPGVRLPKTLPWVTAADWASHAPGGDTPCSCVACVRARDVQSLVTRYREAGADRAMLEALVSSASADDAEKLAAIRRAVDGFCAGKVQKAKPASDIVTFRSFAERWTSGELHRLYPDHVTKKASVDDDTERLAKYVYPTAQDVPIASFTRAHADRLMTELPGTLRPATRRHVAQVINRVLRLAVFAEEIPHSPLPPGWLPKAQKDALAKESLLPSEENQLLAAGENLVPLRYRVLYGFLHREGTRKGEAAALDWTDIDLKNGTVSLDENKTNRPRSWVLSPDVARMLLRWRAMHGGPKAAGPVFVGIDWEKLAPHYRAHCAAAGVDRARLFQRKKNKLRLRAHDMRAFFVTSSLIAGKDVMFITDRTGHTSLGMVRGYERDARRWRELGEAEPVAVDTAIPEFAAASVAVEAAAMVEEPPQKYDVSTGKWTGRGSNPHALRRRNLNPLRMPISPPVPGDPSAN